uniref:Mitochondrial ribosomal protein L53 n=1 Tax=Podarcis muralis TaxID=64176 RepID=A0A670IFI8_PODMU
MNAARGFLGTVQVKSVLVATGLGSTGSEKGLPHPRTRSSQGTDGNCEVKTDVKHDGSEPVIDVVFADGDRLIMKGANLTIREMLNAFNSRCEAKENMAQEKAQKKSA